MPISENIAKFTDQSFDIRDHKTLKKLAEDLYKMFDISEYTDLEKADLAYHGATS